MLALYFHDVSMSDPPSSSSSLIYSSSIFSSKGQLASLCLFGFLRLLRLFLFYSRNNVGILSILLHIHPSIGDRSALENQHRLKLLVAGTALLC